MSTADRILEMFGLQRRLPDSGRKIAEVKSIFDGDFTDYDGVSWSADSFNSLSREGFEHCSTVFKCVDLIALTASRLLLGAYDANDSLVDGHPFIKRFKRPNKHMSQAWLLRYYFTCLLLGGKAAIWTNVLKSGEVYEFWPIVPDELAVEWSNTVYGEIKKMTWTPFGSVKPVEIEHVLYTWFPNPRDFTMPLSPLKAAAQNIDLLNKGMEWNLSLTINKGRSDYWVGVDARAAEEFGGLQPNQITDIEERIEKKYAGSKNAGKPIVFGYPGVTLNELGFNPADIEWLKGMHDADVRIANVYHVPPELIGAQKTYENFEVAERVLYEQAVLPAMSMFCEAMTAWEILDLGEISLKARKDLLKVLKDDWAKLAETCTKLVSNGIATRNEARKKLDWEDSDDSMADVLTVDKEVITLSEASLNAGAGVKDDEE